MELQSTIERNPRTMECAYCKTSPGVFLCECETVLFCSAEHQRLYCTSTDHMLQTVHPSFDVPIEAKRRADDGGEPPAKRKTSTKMDISSLRAALANRSVSLRDFSKQFNSQFPPDVYPTMTHFQPKVVQGRLNLDPLDNKCSIAQKSSPQRLLGDYFNPAQQTRGGVANWDTGTGKTAAIFSSIAAFALQTVPTGDPISSNNTDPQILLPVIPIVITESTLKQNFLRNDLWALSDTNRAANLEKMRAAGLSTVEDKESYSFGPANILTARQFTNMLEGIGQQARRLWAGLSPDDATHESTLKDADLQKVPTAWRKEEGEWVRGNLSWAQEVSTTSGKPKGNVRFYYSQLDIVVSPPPSPELVQAIAKKLELLQEFGEFADKAPTTRYKNNVASIQVTVFPTGKQVRWRVRVNWKDLKNKIPDKDWDYLVDTYLPDRVFRKGKGYVTEFGKLTPLQKKNLRFRNPGFDKADSANTNAGYKLQPPQGKQAHYKWKRLEKGETESEFNPLDRIVLFIDEGDRIFNQTSVPVGERANIELFVRALQDSIGVRVFFYSATIDFFTALNMSSVLFAPHLEETTPEKPNPFQLLPYSENIDVDIPKLWDLTKADYDEVVKRLGSYFIDGGSKENEEEDEEEKEGEERTASHFDDKKMTSLANSLKGLFSVVEVARLRDFFAEKIYRNRDPTWDSRLRYHLNKEHCEILWNAFKQGASAKNIQKLLVYPLQKVDERLVLGHPNFDPDYVVQHLLIDGYLPAAKTLLMLLRRSDSKDYAKFSTLPKQGVVSSVLHDRTAINLFAALLQALGYVWVPVVRQEVDFGKLTPIQLETYNTRRAFGLDLPQELRQVIVSSTPQRRFTGDPQIVKLYGPEFPERQNTFITLSESLIMQDQDIQKPENMEALMTQLKQRRKMDTRLVFFNTKRELRSKGLNSQDQKVVDFLQLVVGKHLYYWPGSLSSEAKNLSTQNPQYAKLFAEEAPVWFVVERRTNDAGDLKYFPARISPFLETISPSIDEQFAFILQLTEFNLVLNPDERQDMLSSVTELYNSDANYVNQTARLLLFGGSFSQGFDVKDCRFMNCTDVAPTETVRIQREGRLCRRNGQLNVPYEHRILYVSTLVPQWAPDWKQDVTIGTWFPRQGEGEESGRARYRTYGKMREESIILHNIEGDPLNNPLFNVKSVKGKPAAPIPVALINSEYKIEPYEAMKIAFTEPALDAIALVGQRFIKSIAFDRVHNSVTLDEDGPAAENAEVGNKWNLVRTNWSLTVDAIEQAFNSAETVREIPEWATATEEDKKEFLPLIEAGLGNQPISNYPEAIKSLVWNTQRTILNKERLQRSGEKDKFLDLVKGDIRLIPIFRRLSKNPAERLLYIGYVDQKTGQPPKTFTQLVKTFNQKTKTTEEKNVSFPYKLKLLRLPTSLLGMLNEPFPAMLRPLQQSGAIRWSPNFNGVATQTRIKEKKAFESQKLSEQPPPAQAVPEEPPASVLKKRSQPKAKKPKGKKPKVVFPEEPAATEAPPPPSKPNPSPESKPQEEKVIFLDSPYLLTFFEAGQSLIGADVEAEDSESSGPGVEVNLLYNSFLDAVPAADDEQFEIEADMEATFIDQANQLNLLNMNAWTEIVSDESLPYLPETQRQKILYQIYAKMLDKPLTLGAAVPLSTMVELKNNLANMYLYGITNWKRQLRLFTMVYMNPRFVSNFPISRVVELIGSVFLVGVHSAEYLREIYGEYTSYIYVGEAWSAFNLARLWSAGLGADDRVSRLVANVNTLIDLLRNLQTKFDIWVSQSFEEITYLLLKESVQATKEKEGVIVSATTRTRDRQTVPASADEIVRFALSRKTFNLKPHESIYLGSEDPEGDNLKTIKQAFKVYVESLLEDDDKELAFDRAKKVFEKPQRVRKVSLTKFKKLFVRLFQINEEVSERNIFADPLQLILANFHTIAQTADPKLGIPWQQWILEVYNMIKSSPVFANSVGSDSIYFLFIEGLVKAFSQLKESEVGYDMTEFMNLQTAIIRQTLDNASEREFSGFVSVLSGSEKQDSGLAAIENYDKGEFNEMFFFNPLTEMDIFAARLEKSELICISRMQLTPETAKQMVQTLSKSMKNLDPETVTAIDIFFTLNLELLSNAFYGRSFKQVKSLIRSLFTSSLSKNSILQVIYPSFDALSVPLCLKALQPFRSKVDNKLDEQFREEVLWQILLNPAGARPFLYTTHDPSSALSKVLRQYFVEGNLELNEELRAKALHYTQERQLFLSASRPLEVLRFHANPTPVPGEDRSMTVIGVLVQLLLKELKLLRLQAKVDPAQEKKTGTKPANYMGDSNKLWLDAFKALSKELLKEYAVRLKSTQTEEEKVETVPQEFGGVNLSDIQK